METHRTCQHCGQNKPFERGSWRWAARYGAYGNLCKDCHLNADRKKNAAQKVRYRAADREALRSVVQVARENAKLKKSLAKLLREMSNEY